MSSHRNPRKRLSWFNRSGNKMCKRYKHSRNHFERDYFKVRSHVNTLTNSFDNRRCLRLLKLCRMFLLLLIHQNTRGFWTNNAHRNTRMPDGSRCRDITDTTHATAYSRARTVERWNGTSGTPELRNNIYLNRVSAQL